MLFSQPIIEALSDMLRMYPHIPCVVDPVMVSTSGSTLLKQDAIESLISLLFPEALLVTPNIPEAELITGIPIKSYEDMLAAGEAILALGAKNVLIKGGHGVQDTIEDILVSKDHTSQRFSHPRIRSRHTHGTGCTLASAIATLVSQGSRLEVAIQEAQSYVANAIINAPDFGQGSGPLNHAWNLKAV
jgi:hydroxymethylpyrimidine/phosphomethylpyrimidine kinase